MYSSHFTLIDPEDMKPGLVTAYSFDSQGETLFSLKIGEFKFTSADPRRLLELITEAVDGLPGLSDLSDLSAPYHYPEGDR